VKVTAIDVDWAIFEHNWAQRVRGRFPAPEADTEAAGGIEFDRSCQHTLHAERGGVLGSAAVGALQLAGVGQRDGQVPRSTGELLSGNRHPSSSTFIPETRSNR
jgi:hypothetical protein